jgi:hypothetical protein
VKPVTLSGAKLGYVKTAVMSSIMNVMYTIIRKTKKQLESY